MSNINYTEIVFKINEEHIKYMKVNEDGSIHYTLEMTIAEQVCPHCGASSRKSKGNRSRDFKFGTIQHHTVTATYLQRRYKFQECHHTFIEKNSFVSRYLRLSKTNMEYLFRQLGEKGSYTEMAKRSDISVSTVIRYCSKLAIPKPTQLPTVLGIDEYKGNAEGHVYQVIITDLRNHSVVDILPKRDTRALMQYFKSFISWCPQIVNAFVLPYSNGFTEGCNNNIKVLKRISYGLRHFEFFRIRILLLSKKNS